MRLFTVVMTDKEFNSYWKFINDEIEKKEQDAIKFAKLIGLKDWEIFVGMFGLPETFFKTIEIGAKETNKPYYDAAEFRFIQAILKG